VVLPDGQNPATSKPVEVAVIAPELVEATSVYPHPPLSNCRVEKVAVPVLSVMAVRPPESIALEHALLPSDNVTMAPGTGLLPLSRARTVTEDIVWSAIVGMDCPEISCNEPGCVENANEETTLNVAVTDLAAVIDTVQVPVPVQSPLQPAKLEPVKGSAARYTVVPLLKLAEQVEGQSIPAGLLIIMPVPIPARFTVNVKN